MTLINDSDEPDFRGKADLDAIALTRRANLHIDAVSKTGFVGWTLVRAAERQLPEGFKVYRGEQLPSMVEYARGVVSHMERSNGSLCIKTDNDDLRITATESKVTLEQRMDGGYDLKPGWKDCVVGYILYAPGIALPQEIAKHFDKV